MKTIPIKEKFYKNLDSIYSKSEIERLWLDCLTHLQINRFEEDFSDENLKKLQLFLEELTTGKPIQYVLGETEFFGLNLLVNESVLIPRPETEELVDLCLAAIKEIKNPKILDIGTGSGCIPLAIKQQRKDAQVFGLDVSENALEIAKSNAKNLNLDVHFFLYNVLNPTQKIPYQNFDLIVSNPPYIAEKEAVNMHNSVLDYEPHVALFVSNQNSLIFYEVISELGTRILNRNGQIWVEINQNLGEETASCFKGSYQNIQLLDDISGNQRFVFSQLKTIKK